MKKALSFISMFFIYLALCAFVVTCSFLLFLRDMPLPQDQIRTAALATFLNVLLLAVIFTILDIIRRRVTVDRYVKQIQNALQKITHGDFSVRLKGGKDSFGLIMNDINRMTEELSGVEALRTDFIADVSHEMKTPLAVINNYCTLLKTEHKAEYIDKIQSSTQNLSSMVTNILKLNRLENQKIFPVPENYSLSEQLILCLLQFESTWEEKSIEIETDIEEDVFIAADKELLSLVWNNLLSNAFKFTPEGGKVKVSLKANDYYITAKVSDTGCGMTKEVGEHIFEKFYQGDTSRASLGNGLGLALVKKVIDITGAEISVESQKNIGSTFTVRFYK